MSDPRELPQQQRLRYQASTSRDRYEATRLLSLWDGISLVMKGVPGFPAWMIVTIPDDRYRRDA